ncbi:MAG TPA: LysM peptidoglycan-binding domain-containing protein [Myxococcaceae bacterium]|jgi:hypothetical protein
MRRLLTAAACFALAAATPALAQGKAQRPTAKTIGAGGEEEQPQAGEGEGEETDQGAETEGTEVNQTERPGKVKIGPTSGGRERADGEVHTVVKGDTLWDLSQQFLGNPWYWPKVWSYNPEIANPHWIYPGNNVRFFPGGDDGPTQVEQGEGPVTAPQEISEGDQDQITPDVAEASPVQVSGTIGYKPRQSASVVHTGFVTQKELEEAGTIDSSFSEARMLSTPDIIYVRFKGANKPRLQERYIIFHTESEVKHPSSLFRYGFLTKILGTARVTDVSQKGLISMQIEETWDPITREDLVGPFGEKLGEKISPRANDRDLKGYIIGALVPTISIMGEYHTVVVDKGSADGVQPGNTFVVVRRQDPIDAQFLNPAATQNDKFPLEDIGQCMAVDVKERASTCLMTRSIREIVFGDRVEMRTGGKAAGGPVSFR